MEIFELRLVYWLRFYVLLQVYALVEYETLEAAEKAVSNILS